MFHKRNRGLRHEEITFWSKRANVKKLNLKDNMEGNNGLTNFNEKICIKNSIEKIFEKNYV